MHVLEIRDTVRIEMVQTALGCPEACLHCGAYSNFRPEDLRVRELSHAQLQAYLTQPLPATGARVIDLCAPYITTDVNTEPLRGDAFVDLAELVYTESGGRCRVCAISHGVLTGDIRMIGRLRRIAELMRLGIVPLTVVSMDYARSKGKIGESTNIASYRETLELLRPALPYGRVTISLQGDRNPESPLWIGRSEALWDQLQRTLAFDDAELARIVVDGRSYTKVGRAKDALHVDDSEDCDVIPDPEFVARHLPRDHQWRGMIRFDGALVVAPNRPGKTYGDSVNPQLWQRVDMGASALPLHIL
jgi:hypothetical protein